MTIGIIREGKIPADKRTPLTPDQVVALQQQYPHVQVLVQSSAVRAYTDEEYRSKGIQVVDSLEGADIVLGIKEVPIADLLPGKTYCFFSHTIKKQAHNRKLLQAILERKIRLVDHELLTDARGIRVVAFGKYAGVVGAYNALRGWGELQGTYQLKPAHACFDKAEMMGELKHLALPTDFRLLLTGAGRVSQGAQEVLQAAGLAEVDTPVFMAGPLSGPAYTILDVTEYNALPDGQPFEKELFYKHPERFVGNMKPYLPGAQVLVTGHFYAEPAPHFLDADVLRLPECALQMVADISCDIGGPIASTLRASTIDDPFYGYDPLSEREVPFKTPGSIGVMAIDNLPCELPRDASAAFGNDFLTKVIPALLGNDPTGMIDRASETDFNGQLMPRFAYLHDWVQPASTKA
jgi:alanine dehydrogenase